MSDKSLGSGAMNIVWSQFLKQLFKKKIKKVSLCVRLMANYKQVSDEMKHMADSLKTSVCR